MLNMSRQTTQPPLCPFCRRHLERPQEVDGLWFEFDGGSCPCGAHFAVDPTARNGGAVLQQALVQACQGDWDQALTLSPGVDYDDGFLRRYDSRAHRLGGQGFGTVYIVRLKSPEDRAGASGPH